jgi:hypothetical protein
MCVTRTTSKVRKAAAVRTNHQRDEVLATWLTISSRNSAYWVWTFSLPQCEKGATKFGRPLAVGTPVANDATTDAHARR